MLEMKNEYRNQTENIFEMEEITNDTKSEAEPKITITMVRTFRYQVVQTRDSVIIQVSVYP